MTSERNPGGFMNQKKKVGKSVPIETEYPTIENAGSSSIRQWITVGDSMLAGITEKCISGNRNVNYSRYVSLPVIHATLFCMLEPIIQ